MDVATLSIRVVNPDVEQASGALDRLAASATRAETATGRLPTVSRDVGRALDEGVEASGRRAEAALRRVEFASFRVIESGNLSQGALRGFAIGLDNLVPAAGGFIGVGVVLAEVISSITKANKESAKAADDAAEAEVRRLNALREPAVHRNRTPQQQIEEQRNLAKADQDRAAASLASAAALEQQAAAEDDAAVARANAHALQFGDTPGETARARELREEARALREHAAQLQTDADAHRQNAAASGGNESRNYYQTARKALDDELATRGLVGGALERERALRAGATQAQADELAGHRRMLDIYDAESQRLDQLAEKHRHDFDREKEEAAWRAANQKYLKPYAIPKDQLAPTKDGGLKDELEAVEQAHKEAADTVRRHWDEAFVQFATTGKANIRSLADDIVNQMERAAAKLIADRIFTALFGGLLDLLGGGPAALPLLAGGAVSGGTAHEGGTIGETSFPMRQLSPLAMLGAPRLHSGLGPGEFTAVLEAGEQVIPKGGAGGVIHLDLTHVLQIDGQDMARAVTTQLIRYQNRGGKPLGVSTAKTTNLPTAVTRTS